MYERITLTSLVFESENIKIEPPKVKKIYKTTDNETWTNVVERQGHVLRTNLSPR